MTVNDGWDDAPIAGDPQVAANLPVSAKPSVSPEVVSSPIGDPETLDLIEAGYQALAADPEEIAIAAQRRAHHEQAAQANPATHEPTPAVSETVVSSPIGNPDTTADAWGGAADLDGWDDAPIAGADTSTNLPGAYTASTGMLSSGWDDAPTAVTADDGLFPIGEDKTPPVLVPPVEVTPVQETVLADGWDDAPIAGETPPTIPVPSYPTMGDVLDGAVLFPGVTPPSVATYDQGLAVEYVPVGEPAPVQGESTPLSPVEIPGEVPAGVPGESLPGDDGWDDAPVAGDVPPVAPTFPVAPQPVSPVEVTPVQVPAPIAIPEPVAVPEPAVRYPVQVAHVVAPPVTVAATPVEDPADEGWDGDVPVAGEPAVIVPEVPVAPATHGTPSGPGVAETVLGIPATVAAGGAVPGVPVQGLPPVPVVPVQMTPAVEDFYHEADLEPDEDETEGETPVVAPTSAKPATPGRKKKGKGPNVRLTARDMDMMRFLARYRMATVGQLARRFETSETALRNRLPKLADMGLITWAWAAQTKPKIWLITEQGLQTVNMILTAPTVKWGQLRHTLGLVDLGITFELAGEIVLTEREIRAAATRYTPTPRLKTAIDMTRYQANLTSMPVDGLDPVAEMQRIKDALIVPVPGRNIGHIPDMVLARQPFPGGSSGNISVELELTRKSLSEWNTVLTAYKNSNAFAEVYYFVMNREVRVGLQGVIKTLGLEDKVKVVNFEPIDMTADPNTTGGGN